MSEDILDELNSNFVAPHREFNGEKLAPYTEGSRLLMLQIKDQEDSSVWFVWCFLYMHILLAKNKKEAIKLAWNKELFKEKLLEWVDNKTESERNNATSIVSGIIEESLRSRIEIVDTATGTNQSKA